MAGGGVKPGVSYGETDELAFNVAKDGVHVHDLQATILHLLGIEHEKFTFRFQGRDFRLTDVHGKLVKPIWRDDGTEFEQSPRRGTRTKKIKAGMKRIRQILGSDRLHPAFHPLRPCSSS